MEKILLMGNPNVGKSSIFTRITGVNVVASNFPGTTVEFTEGYFEHRGLKMKVIDVPGIYSLEPDTPAANIATEILDKAVKQKDAIVMNVVDSTNLERNLNLTLQLIRKKVPVILVLNFWDEAKHTGVAIDVEKLEEILGIPVVPTISISGEGINELVNRIKDAKVGAIDFEKELKWNKIGEIVAEVQQLFHKHHTIRERLGELTIHPWAGIPIAGIVLWFVFKLIRLIGEGLINFLFDPLFNNLWKPLVTAISQLLGGDGFLHTFFIGKLIDGEIDFGQSFGLLTTGLYVPLAAVLPYILAFYLILSILEDTGYLPRLSVLLDRFMHLVGLHGMSFIPFLLGMGCNVPGALATRLLETKRERFIAATLMGIAVPCMAQFAVIIGLLGKYGAKGISIVILTLLTTWFIVGMILKRTIKGTSPEIFVEIPPFRVPFFKVITKKLWMRIKWFLQEAIPFVLLGVAIVNILYSAGIIQFLGRIAEPVVTRLLGLPQEAVGALIIGFLRKDLAVGMLAPLGLSMKQVVVASVVLTMYFPCVATFSVFFKELGLKDLIKASIIMVFTSFSVGAILNFIL